MQKKDKKDKKPFFSRYLEGQELDEARGGVTKPPFVTLKYPSDDDEYPVDI